MGQAQLKAERWILNCGEPCQCDVFVGPPKLPIVSCEW
jgi:hypothetical protein